MIESHCGCGSAFQLPETSVGQAFTCSTCGEQLHIVCAEMLPDGAGGGDFDAVLVIISGPERVGQQLFLGGVHEITFGKSPNRHVTLPGGRLVSRQHAKLTRLDFGPSRWQLEDTNSTNGLFVNDQRVTSQELAAGDMVRIGEFELRYALPAPMPPPPPAPGVAQTTAHRGGVICPGCRQSLPSNSKICVNCGIDLKTGRPLVVSKAIDEDDLAIRADTWIRVVSWLIPFGLLPIASEAFGSRKPITTWLITIVTALASLAFMIALWGNDEPRVGLLNLMHWTGSDLSGDYGGVVGFRWYQLITHALLHDPNPIGFIYHLGGNLLFLWVFGMRVNELLGNVKFAIVYPILAAGSAAINGIIHAADPLTPTLGASGAIMGLAGMYFIFFPVQRVHMAIWCRLGALTGWRCFYKVFRMPGFWLLALLIAYNDLLPMMLNDWLGTGDGVAHWAHLGGFATGAMLAILMLLTRLADANRGDVISVALGRRAWALLGRPGAKPAPI